MKLQLYTSTLSVIYSCTRFFSGELSQVEIGVLFFSNVFLYLHALFGWKLILFNFRVAFFSMLISIAILSKYNELISTIKVENEYVMGEFQRQVNLLKERTFIDARASNFQDYEQTFMTLLHTVTASSNTDVYKLFHQFPKSRPIQNFIDNVSRVIQQSTTEINMKRDQLSFRDISEHVFANKYIINKYLLKGFGYDIYTVDIFDILSVLNLYIFLLYNIYRTPSKYNELMCI